MQQKNLLPNFSGDDTGIIIKLPGALFKHAACGGKWDAFILTEINSQTIQNITTKCKNGGRKRILRAFPLCDLGPDYLTSVPQFPHL